MAGASVKKTKGPALDVPQTDEQADFLLAEYGKTLRALIDLQTDLDAKLADVAASFQDDAAPHQRERDNLFARLQAWAEANRERLTEKGKTKTVDMPAGKVSWRRRPPSVKLRGVEDIIEAIKKLKLGKRFLRTKVEIDKDAMLKDPERAKSIAGVTINSDGEDFIVEPVGLELAEPKQ